MINTVKDLCNYFFNLEEKYELNHLEIQETYPWQLIRIYLYYEIARKLNIFGKAQQSSISLFDKFKLFLPFLKNSLLFNPLKGNYNKEIIIFDHPRKKLFKGEYRDIYSYFLTYYLKGNYSIELMEAPYLGKHFTNGQKYIKYTDWIQVASYFYKKFNKVEFSDSEKDLILSIQEDIEKTLDIDIDLITIMKNHILNFKYDYKVYTKYFKKRNPKQIFIVVAYENKAIVKAAKDLGIETIELQHGTISNYHLGYSYPEKTLLSHGEVKKLEYFPDKLLTFGDYWNKSSSYPIKQENIISIGFPYFEELSRKYDENNNKNKQILFISQGVIGKYLSKFAYETASKLKDFKIIYKLHPGEYETWREKYDYLIKAEKFKNFKIIDNSDTSLYSLFYNSEYQVGAFSTALYEGLMFNCKTFIVDLPGIEYVEDLINSSYVFKVASPDDLIKAINDFSPKEYSKDFFFRSYDLNRLKDLIN